MSILGFKPPYGEIKFGPTTGNKTLMRWFDQLNAHFGVQGQAYYFWKPLITPFRPLHVIEQQLVQGLMKKDMAYIYHSMNHYSVPIGFEYSGQPTQAYDNDVNEGESSIWDLWIYIGDTSKASTPIRSAKLEHIAMDLWSIPPYHVDTRHVDHGILKRIYGGNEELKENKSRPEHGHCILGFEKADLL